MKRLDAIAVLTLVLSIVALVFTAVGTGGVKPAGDKAPSPLPPSTPIVIDAAGREVGALADIVGEGEVGVMLIGADSSQI